MGAAAPLTPGAKARQRATTLDFDLRAGLPAGVALSRPSGAAYLDAQLGAHPVGADVARFSADPNRRVVDGVLLEPAATNYARNVGGLAASDPAAFNTTTGANPGAWGALPAASSLVIPAPDYGSSSGWQVTAVGTLADGTAFYDIRLKYQNNRPASEVNFGAISVRVGLTSATSVPATDGLWSGSCLLAIVAGGLTPQGAINFTARGLAGGVGVFFKEAGIPTPPAAPAMMFASQTVDLTGSGSTSYAPAISIVVRAGETLDITLRIAHRQVEQATTATSFIPTTNASVARAADILHVTVPFAGRWYARWRSHYRNFDAAYDAAGTDLALTPPDAAVAAGVLAFTGLSLSSQPFPPDARALRHAPPPTGPYVA